MEKETKQSIYERVVKRIDDQLRYEHDVLSLISSLWNVYQRNSTGEDSRYNILGDEIDKHYFMNDDWTQDKLYLSVLHILDDEQKLLRFVEGLINIKYDKAIVNDLQKILETESYQIVNDEGRLVIQTISEDITPEVDNRIPFIRCKTVITNYFRFEEENVDVPEEKECFMLTFNNEWNDYGYQTWFRLYYKKDDDIKFLGRVKIMKLTEKNTNAVLPKRFYRLDDSYCSLGDDLEYYGSMFRLFGERAYIYLGELRDAALYSKIHEKFADTIAFNSSLLRDNSAERALREGRFLVFGRDMRQAYAFTYRYEPKYGSENVLPVDIDFDFAYNCEPYHRMIGLIGENGVGKSTLLNNIVESFIGKDKSAFVGLPPIMSKIIVMSYSPFDKFPPIPTDYTVEYHYCGLLKNETELYSQQDQISFFKENLKKILHRGSSNHLLRKWKRIMRAVIDKDIIDGFYEEDDKGNYQLAEDNINEFCQNMSSGESIYVYSLTEIMANIRYDTLLLFDEPEQHLHPHAITVLMKAIYDVLEEFESYAIIATHSPLIVREMVSDNVYTLERDENTLNIAKIGIECFGEDVSVLSDVIFKNMSDVKKYERFVETVAKKCHYDYPAIVDRLKGVHNKLGMNMRLLIQSVIDKHNHEEA